MKTRKLLLLLALAAATTGMQAQRIKGSDTVLPIAQQTAERFMTLNPSARVTVTGGGTGVGISALLDQTTDIAMASRAIKFSEKMKAKAAGEDLAEVPIAYDALAVVVHPSNPVKQLTRQQLEDIFRGKVTNWQQVGGDDRKIVVYSRETSSGTYEFFKESVLKNKNYMSSSLSMPATGAIIQSVSQTRGAIGYVGLAYVSPRIKTLAVSYDGQHYAAPTLENGISKENYYLNIAQTVLERATCLRRVYGAIIVKNDEIISTGYNGSPRGRKNCVDMGFCTREAMQVPRGERYELCRSVHAEANAIISASRRDMVGGTLYLVGRNAQTGELLTDATSCPMCRRMVINAGLARVVIRRTPEEFTVVDVEEWVRTDDLALPEKI